MEENLFHTIENQGRRQGTFKKLKKVVFLVQESITKKVPLTVAENWNNCFRCPNYIKTYSTIYNYEYWWNFSKKKIAFLPSSIKF